MVGKELGRFQMIHIRKSVRLFIIFSNTFLENDQNYHSLQHSGCNGNLHTQSIMAE